MRKLLPGSVLFLGLLLSLPLAAKVSELIAAEGDEALSLRLAVRPGGCSGFSYDMYFDSAVDESDIVNETDGVRVVVDAESATMVGGATIDFRDGGLQAIVGARLEAVDIAHRDLVRAGLRGACGQFADRISGRSEDSWCDRAVQRSARWDR